MSTHHTIRDLAREARAKEILLRELNDASRRLTRSKESRELKTFRLEGYQEGIRAIRAAPTIQEALNIWQTTLYPPPYEVARVFTEILFDVE